MQLQEIADENKGTKGEGLKLLPALFSQPLRAKDLREASVTEHPLQVQDIADENQGSQGEGLVRQQSAVQHATAVLLNKQATPAALVLTYLPWLITASPTHALNVLKVCCIPPMLLAAQPDTLH